MENYFDEYLKSIDIDRFEIKKLSQANNEELKDLSKMYCTLFNTDNKKFIKKNKINGRTVKEGLWDEEPYTLKDCSKKSEEYSKGSYLGVIAVGYKENEKFVLGAIITKLSSKEEMNLEGYSCPFDTEYIREYWMGMETFKREFTVRGRRARHFSSIMRHKLIEFYRDPHHILFFSSTNNPILVKTWKNEKIYVIEKNTTDGKKYQGFRII